MSGIYIRKSRYVTILNILALLTVIGTFVFLLIYWRQIPEQVPGHYNAAGVVDRWGSRTEVLITPVMGLVLYLGLCLVEKFPGIWNTGAAVTERNQHFLYYELKKMLVTIKLVIVLTFSYLTVNMAIAAELSAWFLPLDMLAVFGPVIYYMVRISKFK